MGELNRSRNQGQSREEEWRSLEDGGGLRQHLAAPWGKAGPQLTLSPFLILICIHPHTLLRFRTQGPSEEAEPERLELLSSALRTISSKKDALVRGDWVLVPGLVRGLHPQ